MTLEIALDFIKFIVITMVYCRVFENNTNDGYEE